MPGYTGAIRDFPGLDYDSRRICGATTLDSFYAPGQSHTCGCRILSGAANVRACHKCKRATYIRVVIFLMIMSIDDKYLKKVSHSIYLKDI